MCETNGLFQLLLINEQLVDVVLSDGIADFSFNLQKSFKNWQNFAIQDRIGFIDLCSVTLHHQLHTLGMDILEPTKRLTSCMQGEKHISYKAQTHHIGYFIAIIVPDMLADA